MARDLVAQNVDGPAVRLQQSEREFQDESLAGAALSQQDLGLARLEGERDLLQDGLAFEADADLFEDYGLAPAGRAERLVLSCWAYQLGDHHVQESRQEEVEHQDEHAGGNHRLGSGASHALGAAARAQSVVAADGGDDEAEEYRLGQTLKDVGKDRASARRSSNTRSGPGAASAPRPWSRR